jgi:hypothetical protein
LHKAQTGITLHINNHYRGLVANESSIISFENLTHLLADLNCSGTSNLVSSASGIRYFDENAQPQRSQSNELKEYRARN